MLRTVALIVIFLLCIRVSAQIMPFKNYGIKDGLGNNNVQAVIRDNRGLLWVGTDFGIYWFDGTRFYQPPIKANVGQLYITGFYKDFNGTIWVLTFFNGIFKYESGQFTNYMPDPELKDVTQNYVPDMVQLCAGKYLVLTQNRPYLFDGKKFTSLDAEHVGINTNANCVARLPDQTTVVGTDDGIFLIKYNQNKLVLDQHLLPGKHIEKVAAQKDLLWVLADKSAICFPYQARGPFLGKPSVYLAGKVLKEITTRKNGEAWAIGSNGSFWDVADTVYKIKSGKVTTYSKQNGLPENIQQIYFDDEGVVWFSNRKGLSMLADEYYTFNRIVSGGHNEPISSLVVDDENQVWAGSINGLALQKDNNYVLYPDVGTTPLGYVAWLSKLRDGRCLAGTAAGVVKIEHNKISKFLDINSTASCQNVDSSLWFGGITGEVWTYKDNVLRRLKLSIHTPEMVTALYAVHNQAWIGFRDKGVVLCKRRGDSLIATRQFGNGTGYADLRVRCCTSDHRGNVLFGTRTNGVYVFNATTGAPVAHLSTQNGLNANWIKSLAFDDTHTLYLATNNGINIVTGSYSKPKVGPIKIDDDNINRETNYLLKDGDLFYIGTNEGVLKWMPANLHKDTVPPPVYLTKIAIQGRKEFSIVPYTRNAGSIELPYDQHFISFEFAGISLKNPEKVTYHYMLTGQDNGWSPLTGHNDVAFDLKPGTYTFKVAAENADGIWSRRPAVFHFTIKPPFWLSWWFVFLMVVILVSVAYSAYRYKLSKALALEMLRNKISTDLHDDIGSTLSSISILSEVASREKEQKSKHILGEINERSYQLMEKMDDIVWSISSHNDTVGNLFSRIQQFASTILEARNIEYEFSVPDKIKEMKLDMQLRQHIYLVLKEAINNLIKYSRCSTVSIIAEYSGGILKMEVTDDGVGFDTGKPSVGNGLLNMQKRADAMRGKLCIVSSPGKGTRITLAVQIE